jgi:predicted aldo/keto reductase-like oxidoreductase
VSELGVGTLTMSPIQADIGVERGAEVIAAALDSGVSFIDTAMSYRTYPHVREGLRRAGDPDGVVIASKSHGHTAEEMRSEITGAREALGRDRIDVYLMHLIRPGDDWASRAGAFDELRRARDAGIVGCIGISSHTVGALGCALGNPDIDVVHSCVNMLGYGVTDGTLDDLRAALGRLRREGKGVYAMKPLGGGHLRVKAEEAINFVRALPEVDALVVGMKSTAEVAMNVAIFRGERVDDYTARAAASVERRLLVNQLCTGCGRCVERCDQKALSIVDKRSTPDRSKCILCGYCVEECPVFAIRVV